MKAASEPISHPNMGSQEKSSSSKVTCPPRSDPDREIESERGPERGLLQPVRGQGSGGTKEQEAQTIY